jgi:biopolymer transport protein TolQ
MRFMRTALTLAALILAALALAAPMLISGEPAFAQNRGPTAAPAGSTPEEAPLAAPRGAVETEVIGPQTTGAERAFDPYTLFVRADWIVKSVLIILLGASFWSWVVIIDKWVAFRGLRHRAERFEQNFWSGRTLDDLYSHYNTRADHPIAAVFVAGVREWKRAFEKGVPRDLAAVNDRVEKAMNVSISRETVRLERGLGFLATVGSTAPFIGLFGTVWGIMHSFEAISMRQDTTIAVVAPGISEALFATALGLLAAIPAVVAYNRFVNELSRYTARLDTFSDELSAFLSRQLDEKTRA